jgi:hypothetical protein
MGDKKGINTAKIRNTMYTMTIKYCLLGRYTLKYENINNLKNHLAA